MAGKKKQSRARVPLSDERVFMAALEIADSDGLDGLSMRAVGQRLGVEAMSLYKHVANKQAMLDGLVELVFAQMALPPARLGWKSGLRARTIAARTVLLEHRWAAALIEGSLTPGAERLRHHDALIGLLRAGGFSVELAYHAYLTIDSYLYGFVLQEIWWPFEPEQRPELIDALRPAVQLAQYPHLAELMAHVSRRARKRATRVSAYAREFEFGLDLILDGLEREKRR
jgi:AcrR family transcriptional regulator